MYTVEGVGEELVANEGERHEVGLGPLALAVPFLALGGRARGERVHVVAVLVVRHHVSALVGHAVEVVVVG